MKVFDKFFMLLRRYYYKVKYPSVKFGKIFPYGKLDIEIEKGSKIILGDNLFIRKKSNLRLLARKNSVIELGKDIDVQGDGIVIDGCSDSKITIGNNVEFFKFVTITSRSNINIGNWVIIAPFVYIVDNDHKIDNKVKIKESEWISKPIVIGENTWIGTKVTILKGIDIGENCVIGANSVVTKSFQKNNMIAGIPAKIIKEI
jgi:acetyltransferase-like isoleucine patch superfamily enzyme